MAPDSPFPLARPAGRTAVPVVATARLRLRPHTPADLDAATAMWADPVVTRFTGGRAFSREESWARLLRYTGNWEWFGYGFWAVEEIDTNAYVGQLGLAEFGRTTEPALPPLPEVGWSFVAAAHGRGFASEGVRAALAWADANVAAPRTMCLIDPANTASIRVARRCGFAEVAPVLYKGSRSLRFERARGATA